MPTESPKSGPIRARVMLMLAFGLAAFGTVLAGCATPVPVNSPCGVIKDSLGNVHATTQGGERRLSEHFERGVQAGCWSRAEASKPDLSAPIAPVHPKATAAHRKTLLERMKPKSIDQVEQEIRDAVQRSGAEPQAESVSSDASGAHSDSTPPSVKKVHWWQKVLQWL